MGNSRRLGLVRELIRLLIAVIRLITALVLAGGATNYARRCLAPTPPHSTCRTGIGYLSPRRLVARRAQSFAAMWPGAGGCRTTSTTFVLAGM